MMFDLTRELWIPTSQGLLDLRSAVTAPGKLQAPGVLEHAALIRLLSLLWARSTDKVDPYFDQYEFDLFSTERPFLQVPLLLTESLPLQTIAVIQLGRASGRSQTLFSRDLDARPHGLTPAQAAVQLLTFQQFALTNGKSYWGHTFDAPLARNAAFFAEGETLEDTLRLNAPARSSAPVWEVQTPLWNLWRESGEVQVDETSALAFPWLTVTLEPAALLTQVRLAGGPRPRLGEDPHTYSYVRDSRQPEHPLKNPTVTAKNPGHRAPEMLLVDCLLAVLRGETTTVPVGFARAKLYGASKVRVAVLSSRSGQPVIQDALEAVLPWPKVSSEMAIMALEYCVGVHQSVSTAAQRLYLPQMGGREALVLGQQSGMIRSFWQLIFPILAAVLNGDAPFGMLAETAPSAADQAIDEYASHLDGTDFHSTGRELALAALRPHEPFHE